MIKHGVTLNGVVNPMGSATTATFEFGPTREYGNEVTIHAELVGRDDIPVSIELSDLASETEYHYRLKATNVSGETLGIDATFTTLGEPPTVVTGDPTNIS